LGYGCGTVYRVSLTGAEKVLHSFAGGSDGADPKAGLTDVNGTLYGTTVSGGASGVGAVYSISTSGSEKVLHSFTGGDGGNPMGDLLDVKGTLYGTTSAGGAGHSRGTVYSISTTGVDKVLYDFRTAHHGHDGETPYAGLIDVKGTLYSTTDQGGGVPLDASSTA
jgi:uncharacterized repeat protein (TIGR03803 family)